VDQKFDVVFSNPPYIKQRTGQLSPSGEKSVAKHELKCTIFDIMQKTEELLERSGVAYFIYPAMREEYFMRAMQKTHLKIKNIRCVSPQKGNDPNFFLVSCDYTSLEPRRLQPLILYEKQGKYTKEAQEIFSGRIHDPAV
jgi:tRNA1(Val) A37 N6-methylase TrmN6